MMELSYICVFPGTDLTFKYSPHILDRFEGRAYFKLNVNSIPQPAMMCAWGQCCVKKPKCAQVVTM